MCSACFFFFSSRRRHTRLVSDWSSDVCSSDLYQHHALDIHEEIRRFEIPVDDVAPVRVRERAGGVVDHGSGSIELQARSEERRVGKESKARGGPDHEREKVEREEWLVRGHLW